MDPGFRLVGRNATWTLDADRVVIDYDDGNGTPRLLRHLGSRVVPMDAVATARVSQGDGAPVLRLELREGVDPYLAAAAGQLPDDHDPYRLELDRGQEDLAEHHADGLRMRAELTSHVDDAVPEYLLDAPAPPLRLKAYDGEAHLEPDAVRLRWNSAASSSKRRRGETVLPLSGIRGVEWLRPGVLSGHLALHDDGGALGDVEDDPRVLLFGMGFGGLVESLSFAAAVLAAARTGGPDRPARPAVAAAPAPDEVLARTPDEVFASLRELGALRDSGIVSEGEFEAKKKELLNRL